MPYSRRLSPQAERFLERRKREDEAPRLHDEVPGLVSLQLDIEDRDGVIQGAKYTRRIVVNRAPALFLVPCGDPRCEGDGHDLTREVMTALRSQEMLFRGEDPCQGSVGPGACSHVVVFEGVATYRASSGTASEPPDRPRGAPGSKPERP